MADHSQQNTLENLDFEIQFLEGVLKKSPRFIEALINLGNLYTQRGLYRQGLEVDLKLSALRPDDPTVFYNLACSYSLVDDLENAFMAIQAAVDKGYKDFVHLEKDKDLISLRQYPPFQDFFVKLKLKPRKKRT